MGIISKARTFKVVRKTIHKRIEEEKSLSPFFLILPKYYLLTQVSANKWSINTIYLLKKESWNRTSRKHPNAQTLLPCTKTQSCSKLCTGQDLCVETSWCDIPVLLWTKHWTGSKVRNFLMGYFIFALNYTK